MGLDITAWQIARPLTAAERAALPAKDPRDWWYDRFGDTSALHQPYTAFPATADGLTDFDYIVCEGANIDFRAGSYGGYNDWRDNLAKLAGYRATETDWNVPATGPFVELICNSDCESLIGPTTSAKLAQDFRTWHIRALAYAAVSLESDYAPYWLKKYDAWQQAFTLAAQGGCVIFH